MTENGESNKSKLKQGASKPAVKPRSRMNKEDGEATVIATIEAMPEPDRLLAERLHSIIKARFPELLPRLWYGMPAYARGDKVLCFFQSAAKFKTRYATFGFMHEAKLDDGSMWPTAFAIKDLSANEEMRIAELIKKAIS